MQLALLLALVLSCLVDFGTGRSSPKPAACTCAEQQHCKPLATPPPEFEVYPFVIPPGPGTADNLTADWFETFRWDLITTASWTIGANETVCFAHKKGARVAVAAGLGPGPGTPGQHDGYLDLLFNATAQAAWIADKIEDINLLGADGINFDIEGAEQLSNHTGPALTQFLVNLREAGEIVNPQFQISFCSPIYMGQPICGHANDWKGMIKPNGPVDFYVNAHAGPYTSLRLPAPPDAQLPPSGAPLILTWFRETDRSGMHHDWNCAAQIPMGYGAHT
jgi:hypothetical protein